jgi:hypothetical protein
MTAKRDHSITDAGLKLGLTYHRVRDLALRGVLDARRNEQGRLVISAESIEQYQRQEQQANGSVDRTGVT